MVVSKLASPRPGIRGSKERGKKAVLPIDMRIPVRVIEKGGWPTALQQRWQCIGRKKKEKAVY
jgi:hypothetical protein